MRVLSWFYMIALPVIPAILVGGVQIGPMYMSKWYWLILLISAILLNLLFLYMADALVNPNSGLGQCYLGWAYLIGMCLGFRNAMLGEYALEIPIAMGLTGIVGGTLIIGPVLVLIFIIPKWVVSLLRLITGNYVYILQDDVFVIQSKTGKYLQVNPRTGTRSWDERRWAAVWDSEEDAQQAAETLGFAYRVL